MKRKIAILLAAVMTATMAPMSVFAASSNSVNKTVTVKDDEKVSGVKLKIQPNNEVAWGDSIILKVNNAEFDEAEYPLQQYVSKTGEHEWDYFEKEYKDIVGDADFTSTQFDTIMKDILVSDVELPYKIEVNSKREAEVTLFPIPDALAGETYNSVNKPAYYIPLTILADGTEDITVEIDNNGTSITPSSSIKIATSAKKDGSTTTTIDEIKVGSDYIAVDDLMISEDVYGTFEPGDKVTIKINSGFVFRNSKVTVKAGTNAKFTAFDATVDEDEITFEMPKLGDGKDGASIEKPAKIIITGIEVDGEDDDDYGDVKLTVSGAGLTRETIKVAERGDYGFTLRAIEDPTTIYAGRVAKTDYTGDAAKDIDSDFDEDDFLSATVEFAEITADSWLTSRKLEFKVPEGVKIFGYELDEEEDCDVSDYVSVTDDGRTLAIDKGLTDDEVDPNEASSFELQLNLSAAADFTGDVTLEVSGAGISEGSVEPVKIATVEAPLTIAAETTKSNMGYQKVDTSDIVLTEADAGILVKDEEVIIEMDSIYGEDELGFADEDMDYEITGDLQIKKFDVSKGQIKFTVDRESSDEPSSITIKNVKVGTTRSVPQGTYGFKVYGSALINNYNEDADKYEFTIGNNGGVIADEYVGFFDEDSAEAIKFKNYVDIITETGTLDAVVKVTIGEKTVLVDDQSFDMDVAPYIQTASNSTMVPLRFVTVALGVDSDNVGSADESQKVTYDPNTKTATIFYDTSAGRKIIQFQAGSNIMKIDGTEVPMENGVKAEIVDGRMFVPFRAIGNALNVQVSWDAETRTAIYNQK